MWKVVAIHRRFAHPSPRHAVLSTKFAWSSHVSNSPPMAGEKHANTPTTSTAGISNPQTRPRPPPRAGLPSRIPHVRANGDKEPGAPRTDEPIYDPSLYTAHMAKQPRPKRPAKP